MMLTAWLGLEVYGSAVQLHMFTEVVVQQRRANIIRSGGVRPRPEGAFSYLHLQIPLTPQIPTLITRKQLKVSSFNVYLN